ncbi:beta-glucosidase [Glutamicibacter halophytocola]|uniref:Beta-glucosidase n=1 Tax=Glutamicibacter halophytocola TaxID=1933880 RepID=A0ABX5YCC8_9MICC|nr:MULTISPECIES: GH1 family beta-glucosidase [Glutamicibacter]MBF6671852.1 beta-glucosidase [Glutamicibacter sp. FBE19]NQD39621.1 beta-glucosidase [Glutamicibacter halophytocola]QDY67335.1 beta-glucosidase [Glutamicibacter halophytocola]
MTHHLSQEFSWPKHFLFGSATAAAQIEGAGHSYGKEDSVWDAFARKEGAIAGGENLEVAVDHYHRYREDVGLMRELGLDSYRFSTSWARVVPGGRAVNEQGLDFYSRLVDELLENGILPWLTLYHWDLPQALEEHGGWANRDTAYQFVEYAEAVYGKLGDRVQHWTTFNEPLCSSLIGYAAGEHAPGRQEPEAALAAMHHQHLAHGLATRRLRELGAQELGITLNLTNAVPNDPADPVDLEASRRIDALWNRMYLDPVLKGSYPEDLLEDVGHLGLSGVIHPGDLEIIHQPINFLGVNHYHDDNVSGHPLPEGQPAAVVPTDSAKSSPFVGSEYVTFPARDLPRTAMGWEVNPQGLRVLLNRLRQDYANLPALYITENGASYTDEVSEAGTVDDHERSEYILDHLDEVARSIEDGVDVRGYFVWSLLDNFEWAWGYDKRFGIIYVDYQSQERIIKNSGRAYASLIAANRTMA